MKVHVLLADKGTNNAAQGTLNLLNAGWSVTHVQPGVTPDQAVAIFVEAESDECDRSHEFVLELRGPEDELVKIPAISGDQVVRLQQTITVPSIAGAPLGTPGRVSMLVEIEGAGLPLAVGQSYRWIVEIDGATDAHWQTSFFVSKPPVPNSSH